MIFLLAVMLLYIVNCRNEIKIKQTIIEDYQVTIQRLSRECAEKSEMILDLMESGARVNKK